MRKASWFDIILFMLIVVVGGAIIIPTALEQRTVVGTQGIQGEKGDVGEKGDIGATGLWGFRGLQGERGERGYSVDLPALYKQTSPAVVWIGAAVDSEDYDESVYKLGTNIKWQGTGFFVTPCLIATAGHVVKDTETFEVMFSDGTRAIADFVYAENKERCDVGFIRLRKEDCKLRPYLKINTTAEPGESIIILGHPWGLNKGIAIMQGIIALSNREELFFGTKLLLHTDVAAYPGNSGSPVVDMDGECVGIYIGYKIGCDNFSICTTGRILELALAKCIAFEAMENAE